MHVPEWLVRILLLALAAAEAGADRVDKDEIGKGKPGRRVVDQANRRARRVAVFRRLHDLWSERPQMQKHRGRTRPAVEHKADRARRAGRGRCEIRDRKNLGGRRPLLVGQRKGLGDRVVVEAMIGQRDRVVGRHPRRQRIVRLVISACAGAAQQNQDEADDRGRFAHGAPSNRAGAGPDALMRRRREPTVRPLAPPPQLSADHTTGERPPSTLMAQPVT